MTLTRYVSHFVILIAATLFATQANAQTTTPMQNGQQMMPMNAGQQAQAPAATGQSFNISDSVTNSGVGCGGGCDTGCDQGCGSACGTGCGQRPQLLGRLRNALPSIQMSGGNNCGSSYRSIFGGWNGLDDLNTPAGAAAATNGTFNDGFILGTAAGRYLNNCTRVEMESAWRNNSGDTYNNGGANVLLDGHFNNYSTMLNVYRDFNTNGPVSFYGGLGAGASRQDGDFVVNGNSLVFDDWAFAYQAIAGVNFKRNASTDLFAEFRYFANTETQVEFNGVDAGDFDYVAENIVFGLRFKR